MGYYRITNTVFVKKKNATRKPGNYEKIYTYMTFYSMIPIM